MRPIRLLIAVLTLSVILVTVYGSGVSGAAAQVSSDASEATGAPPANADAVPAFKHVISVVMENKELGRISGSSTAPYLNQLASEYGVATRYYGVTHPSLPNYLAMLGGKTFGVDSDCLDCFQDAPNLVDQIEGQGRTWKAYFESMPRPCFVGDSRDGLYAQKHNPFIYFDNIRKDPARCDRIVPLDQLSTDIADGDLADLIWIGPNLRSSTHDASIAEGDRWLADHLPAIVESPTFTDDGLLVLTYDEGDSDEARSGRSSRGGGRIMTVVASPLARKGYVSSTTYDHYSLLRTIEDAWGLDHLGHAADASVHNLAEFFDGT